MATDRDREQRIAIGIGLIQAGHSIRFAGAQVGIPRATLHEAYMRYLGPDAPDKELERKRAEERILALSAAVAEGTLSRMAQEIDQADHRTVTAWHSVAAQTLGKLRMWGGTNREDGGTTDRLAQLVDALGSQGYEATLSVRPARGHADITAEVTHETPSPTGDDHP